MQKIEIKVADKAKYLDENYPFEDCPSLEEEKLCLHCDSIFKVKEYTVFRDKDGDEFICCPNAPDCNGTVIDWVDTDHFI